MIKDVVFPGFTLQAADQLLRALFTGEPDKGPGSGAGKHAAQVRCGMKMIASSQQPSKPLFAQRFRTTNGCSPCLTAGTRLIVGTEAAGQAAVGDSAFRARKIQDNRSLSVLRGDGFSSADGDIGAGHGGESPRAVKPGRNPPGPRPTAIYAKVSGMNSPLAPDSAATGMPD